MTSGAFVADSLSRVTDRFGGSDLLSHATAIAGSRPVLWGRYFTSLATQNTGQYNASLETAPLAAAGVGILPIARQTRHVSGEGLPPAGAAALGRNDGVANAIDFFSAFGLDALARQSHQYLLFLDVEMGGKLSPAYYRGWSDAVQQEAQTRSAGRVALLPALYLSQDDAATWDGLATAHAAGAVCAGLWVAHWIRRGRGIVPDWNPGKIAPPRNAPSDIPTYFWQYASDTDPHNHPGDPKPDGFDYSQANPALDFAAAVRPYFFFPSAAALPAMAAKEKRVVPA